VLRSAAGSVAHCWVDAHAVQSMPPVGLPADVRSCASTPKHRFATCALLVHPRLPVPQWLTNKRCNRLGETVLDRLMRLHANLILLDSLEAVYFADGELVVCPWDLESEIPTRTTTRRRSFSLTMKRVGYPQAQTSACLALSCRAGLPAASLPLSGPASLPVPGAARAAAAAQGGSTLSTPRHLRPASPVTDR
jgi:hypothetical protein